MSVSRNTALFAASLAASVSAIAADYVASDTAPTAAAQAQPPGSNPCSASAPLPPPAAGQRDYGAIADRYSGGSGSAAPAPAPSPAPAPAANPCSLGLP